MSPRPQGSRRPAPAWCRGRRPPPVPLDTSTMNARSPGSSHRPRAVRLLLAVALLVPLSGAGRAGETLDYSWSLRGFLGHLAGVFLPNQGNGELRTRPAEGGGRITELEITSRDGHRGEFFLYGGETRADGSAARAWSAYHWRGRDKSDKQPVDEPGVADMASGIHRIRELRPQKPLPLRIWSDGKVYPVLVERVDTERVTVPAGTFVADHYRVRGVEEEGKRFWRGGLDLWLARDEVATPVRIQVERGFANVRLDLLPPAATTP